MNDDTEYEASVNESTLAVAPIEEAETALAVVPKPTTALEARAVGIANYLSSAYQKAGTLRLTPEETKILKADFPDDAFLTGAAGKESLIYIDARRLRDRMDEGLGMGGWSVVALRTWNEDYKTRGNPPNPAVRVYHECVLIVRGVYICQAVGDMSYFPGNPEMNYGDAYQGSQSHSLRRCLRDFGVGLQAWSKTFQKGWFDRQVKRPGMSAPATPAATPPPPASAPAPAAPKAKAKLKEATAGTRARFLEVLGCQQEGEEKNLLHSYLVALGWLPNEKSVEQLHLRFVALTAEEMKAFQIHFSAWRLNADTPGYRPVMPYQPHGLDPLELQASPVDPPKAPAPASWETFVMPYGKADTKGKPMGQLPPDEIKFYAETFAVREEINGKPMTPESMALQKAFRAALDQAAAHFATTKG